MYRVLTEVQKSFKYSIFKISREPLGVIHLWIIPHVFLSVFYFATKILLESGVKRNWWLWTQSSNEAITLGNTQKSIRLLQRIEKWHWPSEKTMKRSQLGVWAQDHILNWIRKLWLLTSHCHLSKNLNFKEGKKFLYTVMPLKSKM